MHTLSSHEEKVLGSELVNSSNMKIYFERSGGIEGSPISITLDSSNMTDKDKLKVEKLLNETSFFDLPSKIRTLKLEQGAADYFTYKLIVETDDRGSHSVNVNDISMPSTLYPLIEFLSGKLS